MSERPDAAPIFWVEAVGSTNDEAFARREAGTSAPFWLAARRQRGGRGRDGRAWNSPPGNLYASLCLEFPGPLATAPQLSLLAGVAAHDALAALAPGLDLRLKWPNDLLVKGAKIAGILVEGRNSGGPHQIVIGVGANLAHHPLLPDRRATSLLAEGFVAAPEAAARRLSERLAHWLAVWRGGAGFAVVREAWLRRGLPLGESVTAHAGREVLSGRYLGLHDDGAMRLGLADGSERRIAQGDVHWTTGGPAA